MGWLCAGLSLAVAIALYTRFSIDDTMHRDEAIYAYGGQQLAAGVPLYRGIFDPKTPIAQALAGFAAALAPGRGFGDIHAIRIAFFVFACLSVVAVYALGLALWGSPLAALLGATVFASFRAFAIDALGGPDAKTPGVLFAVVSMTLLVKRRWFWSAFAGSLAFLVWQPFGVYPVVTVAAAAVASRWRGVRDAVAGAAIPLVAAVAGLWIAGSLATAVEATISYPLGGVERVPQTLGGRISHIASEVSLGYGQAGRLVMAAGLVALVAIVALRVRSAWAIVASLLPLAAFSLHDFQGAPDVFPFLPYAAIGVAAVGALALARVHSPAGTAVGAAAVLALFVVTFVAYTGPRARDTGLLRQHERAQAVERLLNPGEHFEALGDPASLVLTGRRAPNQYVYMSSGVGRWGMRHDLGGFRGFKSALRARNPAVVVIDSWPGNLAVRTKLWLSTHYRPACLGGWLLFLAPGVRERAIPRGVHLHPPTQLDCPSLHVEGENPLGLDPGIHRAGVEERRPALAVARDVDVEQRLADRPA